MSDQQPDWDKITEGKIRHGVAVAFIDREGTELNATNMKLIEQWVQFIIHGYDSINDILNMYQEEKTLSDKEVQDMVVEKFDGEVIQETDEEYVKTEIEKAIKTLGQKDKNKVLYQLKQGNITLDNLEACLDKIGTMSNF
tara:strand:- start:83 stop:502 length:420 start_codon:yes stop_codon:yes gene_type:complete